jgi:hypothetical protein
MRRAPIIESVDLAGLCREPGHLRIVLCGLRTVWRRVDQNQPVSQKEDDVQKLVRITVTVIAMVVIVSRGMVGADPGKKVKTTGIETFEPNAIFLSNLKFAPGDIKARSGDMVTWSDNAQTEVFHSVTFDGFCLQFLDAHGG